MTIPHGCGVYFARPVAAVRQALDAARSLSAQSMTVKGQVDRPLAAIRAA